ncbi:ubiquitin-specific protease doa4 [Emmonsiellopsis sp. PD_33]|nr:ubiquitin-specific protease doa4 [Emmonsiellopsis sp. PD_33]
MRGMTSLGERQRTQLCNWEVEARENRAVVVVLDKGTGDADVDVEVDAGGRVKLFRRCLRWGEVGVWRVWPGTLRRALLRRDHRREAPSTVLGRGIIMRGEKGYQSYPRNGGPYVDPQRGAPHSAREPEKITAAAKIEEDVSLNELLRISEDAIQNSKLSLGKGQLDVAFNHYLRASEIAINGIPDHPDYDYMRRQHPGWNDRFIKLIASVRSQEGTMTSVKRNIDQSRTTNASIPAPLQHGRAMSAEPVNATHRHTEPPNSPPLRMPSPSSFQANRPLSGPPLGAAAVAPNLDLRPKSEMPLRKPLSPEAGATDPLAKRFAELRMSRQNRNPIPLGLSVGAQNANSSTASLAELDSGVAHQRPQSRGSASSPLGPPGPRPLGPREMNSSRRPPIIPPKVPLDPMNSSLPRYPSPAYNPGYTVPSQPPSNPPRTSTESARPVFSRQSTNWGNQGHNSNGFNSDDYSYRSSTPNGVHSRAGTPTCGPDIPLQPTIQPEKLHEYLQKYEVLLIDVRPRDRFDNGHIYSKSIMCIEPVALKENVSAEDLEDRLVLSPDIEQSHFGRRNEFDLVVYYDQSTRETSYLVGSPAGTSLPHLRALYDTLYEFNAYKPLKEGRQPALLVGGLDAWVDLFGPHSLRTSQTAAVISRIHARKPVPGTAQPLRRFPTASANSSWEVRKRRLREFTPLNPEEERAWLEKAKNEEIDPNSYVTEEGAITEEPESLQDQELEPPSPFVHDYEDFFRRFPEPQDVRQSMVGRQVHPISAQTVLPESSMPPSLSRPTPAAPRPIYSGVSDGRPVQPPLARQSSASKAALYAASSPIDRMKLPRTGLVNMGSTCYMNSIIQCLNVTVQLTKFFIDNRFHSNVQKNWKGSQGILPGLYANLVRSLWKNDVDVIRPTSFRNFIGRLNPEWAGSRQQDAKEFFDVLLDCLHEDLNVNWDRTPLRPLTFEQELRREQMPIEQVSTIEWNRYCHREMSYISSLFAGQHASRLRCRTCRRTSTTYEAFFSISVEIPTSGVGDLYHCLKSYCQEEMLDGEDFWKCPHCRREREATKQIILTRAPRFLVVHFKRFTLSRFQQTRKIHTPISFPITGLDLTPFMARPSSAPNGSGPDAATTKPELATTPPYIYNAYGIVRHIGSSSSEGHYISLVRDDRRGCWRKFDDQRVTDFNPASLRPADALHNDQAYLVFYERALTN